ncbi:TetR/AcrR family transcriptional regulator [Nocardia sp. NPDC051052]|uniref:TetR/AcrR family transcriptional regulator n=1 Tax=Nocardia sp. NPDC051052 TaxID=3364322 RepID=UPI0037AA0AEC
MSDATQRRASGRSQQRAGSRSVWLRPAPIAREGPPLSRARITDAAVALLDQEGMERLTMRRLAERLEVGSTTLYWHVDTKDDVIDLAIDAVFAEIAIPDQPADCWRDDIVALLTSHRAALLRHPWTAVMPSRQSPPIGPNFLRWMEFLYAMLARTGFVDVQIAAVSWMLLSHVQGSATSESSMRLSADDAQAGREQILAHPECYPTLIDHRFLVDRDWDDGFVLSLNVLLDGIEKHVADLR